MMQFTATRAVSAACTALTRDGVNLVSFSFPTLASSGIDAKVGSMGGF